MGRSTWSISTCSGTTYWWLLSLTKESKNGAPTFQIGKHGSICGVWKFTLVAPLLMYQLRWDIHQCSSESHRNGQNYSTILEILFHQFNCAIVLNTETFRINITMIQK